MSDRGLYVEIRFDPSNPRLFGRWEAWLMRGDGWAVRMSFAWTRAAAERKGRRLYADATRERPAPYRLDTTP